jgi:hypothetical protein
MPFLLVELYQVGEPPNSVEVSLETRDADESLEWSSFSWDRQQASLGSNPSLQMTNDSEVCIFHPDE